MSSASFFARSSAYRDVAQVSAEAAEVSASAAALSETNAAASETAAATSASQASTHADNALASAGDAAVSAGAAASSETNAGASATAAAASAVTAEGWAVDAQSWYDTYRAQYYGAAAGDPTQDPNGDPPTVGDWYFNTTNSVARAYDGTAWNDMSAVFPSSAAADDFVATAGQTQFQLSTNGSFAMVWLNGDYLPMDQWYLSVVGGVYYLNLNQGASAGDDVAIAYFSTAYVKNGSVHLKKSVSANQDIKNGLALGTGVAITWDLQDEIDDTMFSHDTVTNNSRITVTNAGRYRIEASLGFQSGASDRTITHFRGKVNGTTFLDEGRPVLYSRGSSIGTPITDWLERSSGTWFTEVALNAGDYVEVIATVMMHQIGTGTDTVVTVDGDCQFIMRRIR